ncbi:MAG: hypothetical protein JNN12_11550, partial [Bacteroidetes Order II. Incertae sedis bacterium]|nr:hypothetical protein [Bacteroidetes Order II. bacterium]
KAIELISFDNLTPEERTQAKNQEAARITLMKNEAYAKRAAKVEIAKNFISMGLDNLTISQGVGLMIEEVQALRKV